MSSHHHSRTARPASLVLALALAGLTTLTLTGCGKEEPAAAVAAADTKAELDPMEVVVSAEMATNFKTAAVTQAEVASVQEVAGRIEANERKVTRIGAAVTGRVTEVLAETGDRVKAGQTLARVASPELTTAQLAYMRASATATLAERSVERARQLIAADVIGSAELLRRESEVQIARAELRAAGDQLKLMGLSADALSSLRAKGNVAPNAAITASAAGIVIERQVSQGQVAQPGDPLFTVADLSNVWVVGALPEQIARSVQTGQNVQIDVPALGLTVEETPISGKIIYVGDTVSPETRTVTIRTQVDNKDLALKPQMLATMKIQGAMEKTLAIPSLAVVRENDKDHVYVKKAENHYRLTPVELGAASGGLRPVLKGLSEGSQIVVEGAFHLNNERKRAELE
ncbi:MULTISPECIES: efflux RND transporter periplasmic adaptor subunit [Comamonas]|uniref:Efflux RND transporter periplasmic adaptor subunit n=1 Tax=Comamonas thiooxydans TaxID=363952 RepID=A0A5M3M646_9BURK|nr:MULTISPECIES: efflux RND transporter periplasmic adaptor subunit [Comamonas]BCX54012.1 RND transporter [Comamonas testosteroni]ACY32157.1 putative copper efflux system proteincusB precursor [Comamonas thiooxydans]EFI63766.1 putative copper efflux system proteincusB precursor [Comamonas thiooxydans]KKI11714.1 RND transporter MFP subunit [Comamonas thiooxydans]MDH1337269.1 efflux RND transporter periplasmic adaptor subunit [Comamonas thiooxydans]